MLSQQSGLHAGSRASGGSHRAQKGSPHRRVLEGGPVPEGLPTRARRLRSSPHLDLELVIRLHAASHADVVPWAAQAQAAQLALSSCMRCPNWHARGEGGGLPTGWARSRRCSQASRRCPCLTKQQAACRRHRRHQDDIKGQPSVVVLQGGARQHKDAGWRTGRRQCAVGAGAAAWPRNDRSAETEATLLPECWVWPSVWTCKIDYGSRRLAQATLACLPGCSPLRRD